jgi:ubiquinone/menaquinone biosynthesis C-methylase UbiE
MLPQFKRLIKTVLNHYRVSDEVVNVAAHIRDQWVAAKASSLAPGTRVLDAGAGQCQYRQLFSHCEYKTQDFAGYVGTSAGSQVEAWDYGHIDYVSDITNIPVPDGSFDVVLCTEVLEHVARPIETLQELGRILAPKGRLFLTAPLSSGLHQQPYHYYGGFSPHFYKKFLPEFGFDTVDILPTGGLMKHVGQEVHRAGRVLTDYRCGKDLFSCIGFRGIFLNKIRMCLSKSLLSDILSRLSNDNLRTSAQYG